jgi:hypothetical protein
VADPLSPHRTTGKPFTRVPGVARREKRTRWPAAVPLSLRAAHAVAVVTCWELFRRDVAASKMRVCSEFQASPPVGQRQKRRPSVIDIAFPPRSRTNRRPVIDGATSREGGPGRPDSLFQEKPQKAAIESQQLGDPCQLDMLSGSPMKRHEGIEGREWPGRGAG